MRWFQFINCFVMFLAVVLPGCQKKVSLDSPGEVAREKVKDSSPALPIIKEESDVSSEGSSTAETSAPPPLTVAKPENSVPPLEVNVRDLPGFIADENEKFAQEHANQELILTGYVSSFMVAYHHPSQQEAPLAVLCAPEKEDASDSDVTCDTDTFIHCYFLDSKPWDRFRKGAKVTLRGKFIAVRGQRLLDNCQVVAADGMPTVKYTAPELAAAVAANYEDIDKKLKFSQVVVSGVVKGFAPSDDDPKPLLLTGKDTLDIEIFGLSNIQNQGVKVGDKISVIGVFTLLGNSSEPEIMINSSFRFDNLK